MVLLCIPSQLGLVKYGWEFGLAWLSSVWYRIYTIDEFGLVELSLLDNRESSGSAIQFSKRTYFNLDHISRPHCSAGRPAPVSPPLRLAAADRCPGSSTAKLITALTL